MQLDAAGHASIVLSTLSAGTHFVTATYFGDADFAASFRSPLFVTIFDSGRRP